VVIIFAAEAARLAGIIPLVDTILASQSTFAGTLHGRMSSSYRRFVIGSRRLAGTKDAMILRAVAATGMASAAAE
jgi:hypothetical protein